MAALGRVDVRARSTRAVLEASPSNACRTSDGRPTICNWTITAEFFDTHGRWYKTFETKTHLGCWFTNNTQLNVNHTAKTGKMHSTLRSNGNRVNSVGFSIHP
jgi:hypothetical protein